MKKGIILFDIDRTILDTEKLSNLLTENILKVLNTDDIDRIKDIKEKYHLSLKNQREYEPETALRLIAQEFGFIDLPRLVDVYYGKKYEFLYKDCIYPEFFEVAQELKDKFKFGVYSEGTKKLQNHKFESMGIRKYFDKDLIFIVDAKDTQEILMKIPRMAIVVDDKEIICKFLSENGVRAIRLNKVDDRKSGDFETIHSLLELPQILL